MTKTIRLAQREKPPCGPACVEEAWRRFEQWFQQRFPEHLHYWRPGVAAGEIPAFEEAIGRTLPEEVRLSYRLHDGLPGGFFSGMDFLSLKESLTRWREWQDLLRVEPAVRELNLRLQEQGTCIPQDTVRPGYVNPGWVPLVSDAVGNHFGVDLDPGPEGILGQLITFGRDQDQKVVLAWSWGWFLTDLAEELEQGNFRIVESYGLAPQDPAVEHFLDAVELWSKAKSGGQRPRMNWPIDPTWLTWNDRTVARLARAIAEERAFDRLPILGDALEEAGCSDAAILGHCRQPGEHGRGCWLVESLLGKSEGR
jgi:cell wall assembly regulator SMI1